MSDLILTCNAGSNSLKCALYEKNNVRLLYMFDADRIHENAQIVLQDAKGQAILEGSTKPGYEAALVFLLNWKSREVANDNIVAAGHRIVHGGNVFTSPVEVTPTVRAELKKLIPLAPLHQPHNLNLIDILQDKIPNLIQTASFDTAFHQNQPWVAKQFAVPRDLTEEEHLYRYGFHGLSYEYIAGILPEYLEDCDYKKIIVVHLGSGASACAMRSGKSIATTMGLTALDGLMMSTRCGQIDPGIILYLLKQKGMSVNEVEALLYKKSGLLGVSGISADMRDLDDNAQKAAQEAVELFCYMAARQIGGLIVALGGMDALVYTGAMGKKDAVIRKHICDYLTWLPLALDEQANNDNNDRISAMQSAVDILALKTNEEVIIARQTARILNHHKARKNG